MAPAPVEATAVLFKDYVPEGKVPEDNFLVKEAFAKVRRG